MLSAISNKRIPESRKKVAGLRASRPYWQRTARRGGRFAGSNILKGIIEALLVDLGAEGAHRGFAFGAAPSTSLVRYGSLCETCQPPD
jgi:hypothetical protein